MPHGKRKEDTETVSAFTPTDEQLYYIYLNQEEEAQKEKEGPKTRRKTVRTTRKTVSKRVPRRRSKKA